MPSPIRPVLLWLCLLMPCSASTGARSVSVLTVSEYSVTLLVPGLDHRTCCRSVEEYRLQDEAGNSLKIRKAGSDRQAVGLDKRHNAVTEDRLHLRLASPLTITGSYRLHVADQDVEFRLYENQLTPYLQVNQTGYVPAAPKIAFAGGWLGTAGPLPVSSREFQVVNSQGKEVFRGPLTLRAAADPWSGNDVYQADFTALTAPGTYRLKVPGLGRSDPFLIAEQVYAPIARKVLRVFYHSRNGTAISSPWADPPHQREAGIPDSLNGIFHASVGTSPLGRGEKAGQFKAIRRGWFDAGDYGQYMTNAAPVWFAVSTGLDLAPRNFRDGDLGIPESGNGIPDILDELEWGMDWALSMQDSDGGVYWRIASQRWDEGLPGQVERPRFIFEKTTQATAVFAAMAASHARLIAPWRPERSRQVLEAARAAWTYLDTHPVWPAAGQVYRNPAGISAGEYPDKSVEDAITWAAAELFRTTGDARYLREYESRIDNVKLDPTGMVSFKDQGMAAIWAYLMSVSAQRNPDHISHARRTLIAGADWRLRMADAHPFRAAMHPRIELTGWGNFAHSTRAVLPLLQAYQLTGDTRYRDLAWESASVQLGSNPQGLSYITGTGARTPEHPLSKLSQYSPTGKALAGIPVNGPHYQLPGIWPSTRAVNQSYWPESEGVERSYSYPALRRYTDSNLLPPMSEPTIAEVAITGVSLSLLSDEHATTGWPVVELNQE